MPSSTTCRFALPVLLGLGFAFPSGALANGNQTLSLRDLSFTRSADRDLTFYSHWRVTICTSSGARVRIRAIFESIDFGRETRRVVRRQRAGCKRHRLRFVGPQWEGLTESRLRVAWRGLRRGSAWHEASDPAPD
jgi:hypothetical protein